MGKISIKIAIVGSRSLKIDIAKYIPDGATEIISGGARGIDSCAMQYAHRNNLKLTEFLPDYEKYGKAAPLRRNELIVDRSDMVIAIWDGNSRGTKYTVDYARKRGKKVLLVIIRH